MFLQVVNFPDNNGSVPLIVKSDTSEIKIEYEFCALNNQHYMTITNKGFTLEKVIPRPGSVLNYLGVGICDLFVICYTPLFNGLLGFPEEFVCKTAQLIVVDMEGLQQIMQLMTTSL